MKLLLLLTAFLFALTFTPSVKADCGPGEKEVFLPDWSCQWIPDGEFICSQSAYCVSACDPYECADSRGVHKPAQKVKETELPTFRIPVFIL